MNTLGAAYPMLACLMPDIIAIPMSAECRHPHSVLCVSSSALAGETPQRLLRDSVKDASEKAKEAAKSLASAASVPQKPQQYV